MSRHRTPTIHCDGQDGECSAVTVDYYECTVDYIGDVKITRSRPALGWVVSPGGDDLCPSCAVSAGPVSSRTEEQR